MSMIEVNNNIFNIDDVKIIKYNEEYIEIVFENSKFNIIIEDEKENLEKIYKKLKDYKVNNLEDKYKKLIELFISSLELIPKKRKNKFLEKNKNLINYSLK